MLSLGPEWADARVRRRGQQRDEHDRLLAWAKVLPDADRLLLDQVYRQGQGFADLGLSLEEGITLLSLAGLGEAFVVLRKPDRLSEASVTACSWRVGWPKYIARLIHRVIRLTPMSIP